MTYRECLFRGPLGFGGRQTQDSPTQYAIIARPQAFIEYHAICRRIDRQQPHVEQGVQVTTQQQTIRDMIGFGAAIRDDMGRLQDGLHLASANRTTAIVSAQQCSTKCRLALAPNDRAIDAAARILDAAGVEIAAGLYLPLRDRKLWIIALKREGRRPLTMVSNVAERALVAKPGPLVLVFFLSIEQQNLETALSVLDDERVGTTSSLPLPTQ